MACEFSFRNAFSCASLILVSFFKLIHHNDVRYKTSIAIIANTGGESIVVVTAENNCLNQSL